MDQEKSSCARLNSIVVVFSSTTLTWQKGVCVSRLQESSLPTNHSPGPNTDSAVSLFRGVLIMIQWDF